MRWMKVMIKIALQLNGSTISKTMNYMIGSRTIKLRRMNYHTDFLFFVVNPKYNKNQSVIMH